MNNPFGTPPGHPGFAPAPGVAGQPNPAAGNPFGQPPAPAPAAPGYPMPGPAQGFTAPAAPAAPGPAAYGPTQGGDVDLRKYTRGLGAIDMTADRGNYFGDKDQPGVFDGMYTVDFGAWTLKNTQGGDAVIVELPVIETSNARVQVGEVKQQFFKLGNPPSLRDLVKLMGQTIVRIDPNFDPYTLTQDAIWMQAVQILCGPEQSAKGLRWALRCATRPQKADSSKSFTDHFYQPLEAGQTQGLQPQSAAPAMAPTAPAVTPGMLPGQWPPQQG